MAPRANSPIPLAGLINARRELLLCGAALAFGLGLIPILIWVAGHWTLGPYTHGDSGPGYGPLTLFADYFAGLWRGSPGYWIVAVGPLLLLWATRLWLALIQHFPRSR